MTHPCWGMWRDTRLVSCCSALGKVGLSAAASAGSRLILVTRPWTQHTPAQLQAGRPALAGVRISVLHAAVQQDDWPQGSNDDVQFAGAAAAVAEGNKALDKLVSAVTSPAYV